MDGWEACMCVCAWKCVCRVWCLHILDVSVSVLTCMFVILSTSVSFICTCCRIYMFFCTWCVCACMSCAYCVHACMCVCYRGPGPTPGSMPDQCSYSGPNQTHACCNGLMNTNRRQRRKRGEIMNLCVCACPCKQRESRGKWRQRKWGLIRRAEGGRIDKGEWKTDIEYERKRTTTWFHPLLSHSWQRHALVTDRQITLLWLIKPGYRWREGSGRG